MLDYCSIILTVHAALWVGGGYIGTCPPRRRVDGVKHERARESEGRGRKRGREVVFVSARQTKNFFDGRHRCRRQRRGHHLSRGLQTYSRQSFLERTHRNISVYVLSEKVRNELKL